LRVHTLRSDGASPLYGTTKGPELAEAIGSITSLLEPRLGRRVA
jgi:hypothetical protein